MLDKLCRSNCRGVRSSPVQREYSPERRRDVIRETQVLTFEKKEKERKEEKKRPTPFASLSTTVSMVGHLQ